MCQFTSSCVKTRTTRQLGHLGFINYNNTQNCLGCMNEFLVLRNQIWAEFTHYTIYLVVVLLLPLTRALQPIPPRVMTYCDEEFTTRQSIHMLHGGSGIKGNVGQR